MSSFTAITSQLFHCYCQLPAYSLRGISLCPGNSKLQDYLDPFLLSPQADIQLKLFKQNQIRRPGIGRSAWEIVSVTLSIYQDVIMMNEPSCFLFNCFSNVHFTALHFPQFIIDV